MGSRYGGIKQMEAVGPNGETLLDYSVYDALRHGFGRVVFVIRKEIEKDFKELVGSKYEGKAAVAYVYQSLEDLPEGYSVPSGREKPWGTGHAVYSARDEIKENFGVINADDFYGEDAYRTMGTFLSETAAHTNRYALLGYVLENTLSPHGSVSRGICRTDAENRLMEVTEHKQIEERGGTITGVPVEGSERTLSPKDIVSMNFFGFTPGVFPLIGREFERFLSENNKDPKAEFYIPTFVTTLIQNGEAETVVLPTDARWFGVTYREDRPRVLESIRSLIDNGVYPSPLT
jgi:NDP-sugar pyrophosphorylase family protein